MHQRSRSGFALAGAACAVIVALFLTPYGALQAQPPTEQTAPAKLPAATSQPAATTASKAATPCTWCTRPSPPDCKLCVRYNPPIKVGPEGTVAELLSICNATTEPQTLALIVTDFYSRTSDGRPLPIGAAPSLEASDSAHQAIVRGEDRLPANACIGVTLKASKLMQAGMLTAKLESSGQALADLVAIRYPMPFALKVDGARSDSVEITFVRGAKQASQIVLRNEDEATYRFRWRFELDGSVLASDVGVAMPLQRVMLPVSMSKDQFPWLETGFLRAGERKGQLVLEHEPDADFRERPIEHKIYPVTARLNRWSAVWQGIWNTFWIVMALIVGVLISLLINYTLPVQRQRTAIKQSLADLEGRLAGLGGVIRSRRLSLLRTEKKRLRDELRSNLPISAATEAALPKLVVRVQALEQRVGLTAQAGGHLAALRNDDTIAMPEAEQVIALCRAALDVADKPLPTESELVAANEALKAAAALRAASDEPPSADAAQKLRDLIVQVQAGSVPVMPETQPLSDLLDALRGQLAVLPTGDLSRERYIRATAAVWKAQSVLEFFELLQASGASAVRDQRLARVPHLLNALLPGPCESIRRADEIVREVEQGVSKAQLIEALRARKTIRVEIDPPTPNGYQLVEFRVRFDEPGLDAALARQQIRCCWSVSGAGTGGPPTVLQDESWSVCHYFEPVGIGHRFARVWARMRGLPPSPAAMSFKVDVVLLEDFAATQPLATGSAPVTVEAGKSYAGDAALLSIGSAVVTVLLVSIGLLAGAQEKIQSLDWWSALIAVLVIGFGADALKRVLMKP